MKTALPDVNVLIARMDKAHVHDQRSRAWFHAHSPHPWATCQITENAVLRILGNTALPNSSGPPAKIADMLRVLRRNTGHTFWNEDISLLDEPGVHLDRLVSHTFVTDIYLLALARKNDGVLVTFDQRIRTEILDNSGPHLLVL